jgi:Tfp pilus assembly protein FimT
MIGRCSKKYRHCGSPGFTILELVIVVGIAMVLAAIAVPSIQSSLRTFAVKSAVSSLTGAIQGNRYQAIFHGCPYQVAFTAATYSYQVSSEAPAAGGTNCLAAYANVGTAIPLQGSGVTLNQDVTLVFHPSGQVQATTGNMTNILLTNASLTETITVSAYGRVNVTP